MTWPKVPLRDLLDVSIGGVWGREAGADEVDVRVWRVTELKPGGRLEPSTAARRSVSTKQYESRALRVGDLLLEKSGGGPTSPVGRVGLVSAVPEAAICSNFMQLLRPRPGLVDPRFLHLYLNHLQASGATAHMQTASTNIRNIKASSYAQLQVPVPPLDEQRRIVAILEDHLSRFDAAAADVAAIRQRLVALDRATLDRHFGGMEVPLADLIEDISAGKSFGAANAPAKDDEWGIIKVSAMTWGQFDPTENKAVPGERADPRFEIQQGDLLVSRANTAEYVGSSVLVGPVRPRLLLSDKSLRVTPKDDVNPQWLWRALQAPSARRQITALATGTKDSMRNIAQGALKQVRLPHANESEQRDAIAAFERVASASAALRSAADLAESRLGALRRSVLATAFSGRLTRGERFPSEEELQHV